MADTPRVPTRQVTLVCAVLTEPGMEGRFVGHVEVVATGELVSVRNVDELLLLVQRVSAAQ